MQRSRRWFLRAGALWSSILVACRSKTGTPVAEPRSLGGTVSSYGSRSRFETGVMAKYAKLVSSAAMGAVTG